MASSQSSRQDLFEVIRSLTEQLERSDKTLVEREAQHRNQMKLLEQELRVSREQRDALAEEKSNLLSQLSKERSLKQEAQGQLALSYQVLEAAQKETKQLQDSLNSTTKQYHASIDQARQEAESWKSEAQAHLKQVNARLQNQSHQMDRLMNALKDHMANEARLLARPTLSIPPNASIFGPLVTVPLSRRIKQEEGDDSTEPSTQDGETDESVISRSEEGEHSSAVSSWTESFAPRKRISRPEARASSNTGDRTSKTPLKKRKVEGSAGRSPQQVPLDDWEDDEDDEMAIGYAERKSLSNAISPSGKPAPVKPRTAKTPSRILNNNAGGTKGSGTSSVKKRR